MSALRINKSVHTFSSLTDRPYEHREIIKAAPLIIWHDSKFCKNNSRLWQAMVGEFLDRKYRTSKRHFRKREQVSVLQAGR